MFDYTELDPIVIAFLNSRPKSFGVTKNHVWSLKKSAEKEIEIKPEKQADSKMSEGKQNQIEIFDYQKLTPVEIHVLDLMRLNENWRISYLRKKLLEEMNTKILTLNTFNCLLNSEEEFRQFLKLRPKLFCMTDTHVRSLVDKAP